MARKKSGKGSQFEREFCKLLSRWYTLGDRDDIFWRTQTSGGRATQRRKSRKKTFGQNGDVAATDPCGLPLLKLMTIELKNGYIKDTLLNLLDFTNSEVACQWEKWIMQVTRDAAASDSYSWMIVHKRTMRHPIVCVPEMMFIRLKMGFLHLRTPFNFIVYVVQGGDRFYLFRLEDFWQCIDPVRLMGKRKLRKKRRKK